MRVLAALNGLELFGHERGNIEVFRTLRKLGAEILIGVNARDEGGDVAKELRKSEFQIFSLPFNPQWSIQFVRKHPSMALTNPLAILRCSWRFRNAINRFSPTHIHIGSPLVYSYLSLALAWSRLPMIYRMGDCPPSDSKFNLGIWRMAMSRTTRIVANSGFVRHSAIGAGVPTEKIEIIYGVAPTRTQEAVEWRAEQCDGLERLVYVGALAEHKGLIPLVEAMAVLLTERPLLRLDIFGGSIWDGAFRSQLSRLIADRGLNERILLHGHVDDPSPHYRRAAVHVAPSMWEEPGANVVLEAKRQGTPSIVFPSGGLPEMVRHKVDGYVCHEKSTAALVEAVRWMLEDKSRLMSMRIAVRADHELRFAEQRFANQWAAVYRCGPNDWRIPAGDGEAD